MTGTLLGCLTGIIYICGWLSLSLFGAKWMRSVALVCPEIRVWPITLWVVAAALLWPVMLVVAAVYASLHDEP